jgi:hypothetical protein
MDLLPGFIQGVTRVTISYPFDVVKVGMQKNMYDNTYVAIKDIVKTDPKKFYRGSQICYLTVPFDRAFQYYIAEKLNGTINPFLLSGCIGFFVSLYNVPVNYVTTNIALTPKQNYNGLYNFISNIPLKNLYKGFSIELPRTMIQSSAYMGMYFYLRNTYNKENKLYLSPLLGGLSSAFCWTIIFPIDTIKTDKQTTKNISIPMLIKERYIKYGIKNFYIGLVPVLIRSIPSASCGMLSYEFTKNLIKNFNDH